MIYVRHPAGRMYLIADCVHGTIQTVRIKSRSDAIEVSPADVLCGVVQTARFLERIKGELEHSGG